MRVILIICEWKKISTSKSLRVRIIHVSQTKGKNLLVVSPVCLWKKFLLAKLCKCTRKLTSSLGSYCVINYPDSIGGRKWRGRSEKEKPRYSISSRLFFADLRLFLLQTVAFMSVMPRANGRSIVGQQFPTLRQHCWMLHVVSVCTRVCTPSCMLLYVVADFWELLRKVRNRSNV